MGGPAAASLKSSCHLLLQGNNRSHWKAIMSGKYRVQELAVHKSCFISSSFTCLRSHKSDPCFCKDENTNDTQRIMLRFYLSGLSSTYAYVQSPWVTIYTTNTCLACSLYLFQSPQGVCLCCRGRRGQCPQECTLHLPIFTVTIKWGRGHHLLLLLLL